MQPLGYEVFVQDYDIPLGASFVEAMHDGIINAHGTSFEEFAAARTSATSCAVAAIEPRRLRKKSNLSAAAPGIGPMSRRRPRQYGKDWTLPVRAIVGARA